MSVSDRTTIFRFGIFEFNSESSELRKNGLKVRLSPQSSKLLHLLLKSNGDICTREQIRGELWPRDTFVDFEHSLNKVVWGLRQALGELVTNPRYIETVAGQGYRFLVIPQDGGRQNGEAVTSRICGSLAVIPFANLSANEECTFVATQLACRLTNEFSKLGTQRVLAYGMVKHCDAINTAPRTIGEQLGADAVLSGEILQRDRHLILNLELIDVHDGAHIWGMQLEEALPQATDRVREIAQKIVQKMRVILARTSKTIRSEAHELKPPHLAAARILKPPRLNSTIRAKSAFLFA